MVVADKREIGPCRVELSIKIEPERVRKATEDAFRELSAEVSVPGFRKGKAPREMVERVLSQDRVRKRAEANLIEATLEEALEEGHIDGAYDAPALSDELYADDGSYSFKLTFPVVPRVELGEYRGLKIVRRVQQVTPDQVEARLEELRNLRAEYVTAEPRPLQVGDYALADLQQEGQDSEPRRARIRLGDNAPAFDEGITGMSPGEERTLELPHEPDAQHPSGTTRMHVKIVEVQERKVPDLDDEFARKQGGYASLEDLREDVRRALENAAEEAADQQVEDQLVREVVDRATVVYPPEMKEKEVADYLQAFLKRLEKAGLTLDEYLQETGRRMEQVTAEMEQEAERGLRVGLVLGKIASQENLKVEDSDEAAELARMSKERGIPPESLRALLEKREELDSVRNRILRRKILDFLIGVSNIKNVS